MKETARKNKAKLPYEKPELKTIDLAAEEVLVVGCKTDGSVAGFGNAGPFCTIGLLCHGEGS